MPSGCSRKAVADASRRVCRGSPPEETRSLTARCIAACRIRFMAKFRPMRTCSSALMTPVLSANSSQGQGVRGQNPPQALVACGRARGSWRMALAVCRRRPAGQIISPVSARFPVMTAEAQTMSKARLKKSGLHLCWPDQSATPLCRA